MRRIQIHVEESLDDAAAEEAARHGVSKAALIRDALRSYLTVHGAMGETDDPWAAITGWLDDEPVDDIDEVIYGGTAPGLPQAAPS